jgi:hypothetical protein
MKYFRIVIAKVVLLDLVVICLIKDMIKNFGFIVQSLHV